MPAAEGSHRPELRRVPDQSGSTGEHAGGSATVIGTGAAQQRALQECHVRSELGGTEGSCKPRRTATQDQDIHSQSVAHDAAGRSSLQEVVATMRGGPGTLIG